MQGAGHMGRYDKSARCARRPVDAEIAAVDTPELTLNAQHLAAEILRLHCQPADCWTSELDLRPAKEAYWQHC